MATYTSSHRDQKTHYDDLIDDQAAPYSPSAHHQTYNIQTSPAHRRGPSIPLHSKSTQSLDDDDSHHHHPVYPPPKTPDAPMVLGSQPIWRRVRTWFFPSSPFPWYITVAQILPDSIACRLFILTVLIETAVDLTIQGELLIRVTALTQGGSFEDLDSTQRKMRIYLSIFALAHLFQFVIAIDAVAARNTLQFMALILFNALFLIYSGIQILEIREAVSLQNAAQSDSNEGVIDLPITVLTTTLPIVISIAEVAYIALGWKIYHEFGWKVYKFLGADRRIKQMYANYQVYLCLVKFDVFFWAAFSIQFIWLVLKKDDWEYYLTCAALPLSLILLVEGLLAARYENKWMMATFMSGCVAALVYFVYKLAKVLMYNNTDVFKPVWKSLTIFSVLATALLIATFVLSVLVLRNFGYGLKDALARKDATHQRYVSQGPHQRAASKTLNRMSID